MLYKILNIDNLDIISQQAYKIIEKSTISDITTLVQLDKPWQGETDRFNTIPELVKELTGLGLYHYWQSTAVVTVYKEGMPVHVDTGDPEYSLIIPVHNSEYSWLVFYNSTKEPERRQVNNSPTGAGYLYYDPAHLTEIDRVKVDRPILANIKVPHGVEIESNAPVPRITITVRMNKDFTGFD